MFKKSPKKDKRTSLDREIDEVLAIMGTWQPDSAEYSAMTVNLEKLYKAKAELDKHKRERGVSRNTLLIVGGNLLGLLVVLGYEKANVITSKAFGWIIKGRV